MVSIAEQLACARRELAMRRRAYPRFIDKGSITPKKAADEIAAMEAIIETLQGIDERERLI